MSRHKSADDDKVLAFSIPTKIMNRSFEGFNFIDFSVLIVEYVKTVFFIVEFSSWVVVGLKFHEKFMGRETKSQFNFFSFFDGLLIKRLFGFMRDKFNYAKIVFFVKEERGDQVMIVFADFAYFKKFHRARIQLSLQFPV